MCGRWSSRPAVHSGVRVERRVDVGYPEVGRSLRPDVGARSFRVLRQAGPVVRIAPSAPGVPRTGWTTHAPSPTRPASSRQWWSVSPRAVRLAVLFAAAFPERVRFLVLWGTFSRLLRSPDYEIGPGATRGPGRFRSRGCARGGRTFPTEPKNRTRSRKRPHRRTSPRRDRPPLPVSNAHVGDGHVRRPSGPRRPVEGAIRTTGPRLVEVHMEHVPAEEIGPLRDIPHQLDVRHEPRNEQQVERTIAHRQR